MHTFDRFESRTLIQAVLEMKTPLSIGGRSSLEPTGTDLPVVKDVQGLPFIPGSSLKGVVRSQMERILRSLPAGSALKACDPLATQCIPGPRKDEFLAQTEDEEEPESALTERIWNESCTTCRLFGSPWLASRLLFKDACLGNAGDLPLVTQIRDGVAIDRDLGAARSGLKYDFEVAVPGSRFQLEILAENVEEWEIGLLLAVLRPWEEGHLALGGKSTRGPGWGRFVDRRIFRVERQDLLDYLTRGEMRQVEPEIFLEAFNQRIGLGGGSHA